MSVDTKNILRIDFEDMFEECRSQSYMALRPYTAKDPSFHPDDYAISANEMKQAFNFAMDGASKISDYASMVKHHTQTGVDALTYYEDYEKPEDAASYDEENETITTPEGAEDEPVANIMASRHVSGQKLTRGVQDVVIFQVTDLDDEQNRYTVVQQHIRTALINYTLHKWWSLVGMNDLARKYFLDFEESAMDVRHNSAKNHARKNIVRKTRPSI